VPYSNKQTKTQNDKTEENKVQNFGCCQVVEVLRRRNKVIKNRT